MLPVALQMFSIRDDAEKDFAGSLQKVKAMGYEGVELAGIFNHTPREARTILADIGLVPVSVHGDYAEMMDDPEGVLGSYREIGSPYVVISYMEEQYRFGTVKEQEVIAGIRMLAETAGKFGIKMLYHNHDFEFIKIGGEYALDILLKTIPASLLEAELDTCWIASAGLDAPAYLRKYSGRLPLVHLKDFATEGGVPLGPHGLSSLQSGEKEKSKGFEFRPLGKGQQNIPALLEAASGTGTKWLVVEQDEPSMGKTAMECASMSIQYLRSL